MNSQRHKDLVARYVDLLRENGRSGLYCQAQQDWCLKALGEGRLSLYKLLQMIERQEWVLWHKQQAPALENLTGRTGRCKGSRNQS